MKKGEPLSMSTYRLEIAGMSCDHCVRAVRSALEALPAVTPLDVRIGSARIDTHGSAEILAGVARAVEEAGYHLVSQVVEER